MGYFTEEHIESLKSVVNAYVALRMVHGDVLNHRDGQYVITKDIADEMSECLDYAEDTFVYDIFPLFGINVEAADELFDKVCLGELQDEG